MWFGVGLDVGTTNTKVVGVRVDAPHPPAVLFTVDTPTPSDAHELRAQVHRLLVEAAARLPHPASAIGIASMAETGVPLDACGAPLTPLIRWQDADRADDVTAVADGVGADALFAATGVRLGPKPPLVMWHWLRRTSPAVLARMRWWAGVADWLHLGLTGRLVTDHTLAGRTGAYRLGPPAGDPPTGFDPDLVTLAGMHVDQLPEVRSRTAVPSGLRLPELVAAGYPSGTPVLVAGHDHQVAAWAAGVRRAGQTADSVGTAEAVLSVVGADVHPADWDLACLDPAAVARQGMSLVHAVSGPWAVLAGTSSAGGYLQWYADTYGSGDVAADLAQVDLHPTPAVLLPYLAGRQCPAPDPRAEPTVLGTPSPSAAVHAVAYQAAWMAQTQAALTGRDADELVMIGEPLRRNRGWATVKAALASGTAAVVDVDQPVAAGAAVLAGVAAGDLDGDTRLPSTPAVVADDFTRQALAQGLRRFIAAATRSRSGSR